MYGTPVCRVSMCVYLSEEPCSIGHFQQQGPILHVALPSLVMTHSCHGMRVGFYVQKVVRHGAFAVKERKRECMCECA